MRNRMAAAAREAIGLLIPVLCVGCGEQDVAVCPRCSALMLGPLTRRDLHPGFPVWAGTEYAGVARRAILALKNDQRTDVATALAGVLSVALVGAVEELAGQGAAPDATLAALPSSRAAYRRRGYRPVDVVVARTPFTLDHPLAWRRQPGDQIGLGIEERHANLAGSLRARRGVSGRCFLLVDDVVTTGVTLIEARRALTEVGCSVLGAVVIAATERQGPGASRSAHFAE